MKCLEVIKSKIDNTVKYVFESNNSILEFSYINKNDGKDIIVVPTQTSCNLGCKFCFLTGLKLKVRNLTPIELVEGITHVLNNVPDKNKVLLVSFMGCGEPLLNINNVIDTMKCIEILYAQSYDVVRFAVASLIPDVLLFNDFRYEIKKNNIKCKFHYSLHTTDFLLRKQLMPGAAKESINAILPLLRVYMREGNSVEIHYSLMDGINDTNEDVNTLTTYLGLDPVIPIKFLKLSEKEDSEYRQSKKIDEFRKSLEYFGIPTEYYEPPGSDVGSSCGQFLLDYYERYGNERDKDNTESG